MKPQVIEELSYEQILNDIKTDFKKRLKSDEQLLESEDVVALMEAFSYRETILRARINHAVSQCLIEFATGSNLDAIATMYGVTRLPLVSPTAVIKFTLSATQNFDITIPKGLVLGGSGGETARLLNDVVVQAGKMSATGVCELDGTLMPNLQMSYMQVSVPHVSSVEQVSEWTGGSESESDESLRERCTASLARYSTAGSKESYTYYAKSASSAVRDVAILNGGDGSVNVYIRADYDVSESVQEALSADNVRPLTDRVQVIFAYPKKIKIYATLELSNLLLASRVSVSGGVLDFGIDMNLSQIYADLHKSSEVRRANITRITVDGVDVAVADVVAQDNEYIDYSFELTFASYKDRT